MAPVTEPPSEKPTEKYGSDLIKEKLTPEVEKAIENKGPGVEIFKKGAVPFQMKLHGFVNGKEFTIMGMGEGDARVGKLQGKWINIQNSMRPETGKSKKPKVPEPLPMDWGILASTFNSMQCFAKYPEKGPDGNPLGSYFQSCMPLGYTNRRVTRFGRLNGNDDAPEEEGIMKMYSEVTVREGCLFGKFQWVVNARVHIEATFKEGSPLLQQSTGDFLQSLERTVPFEDGLKNYVQYFYPIKNSPTKDMIVATQMTHNRPFTVSTAEPSIAERFNYSAVKNPKDREPPTIPSAHFKRTECKQWIDDGETREHRVQDEITQFLYFKQDGLWKQIGRKEGAWSGGVEADEDGGVGSEE